MTNKKKIACFFTGGYTELNAMKAFLEKINDNVVYKQLCPNGQRKSKESIRKRIGIENSQSGLTGNSLIDYVLQAVKQTYFTSDEYDAILIEDDKDNRFYNSDTLSNDIEEWNRFKSTVQEQLKAEDIDIPVIFLFASPEVESWFISDWDNSFGKAYIGILDGRQNAYFSTVFRKYVNDQILTEKYTGNIEEYGYFGTDYKKLSEEIQSALINHNFLPGIEHKPIFYSKRKHGEIMLESINPNTVLKQCSLFFKEGYYALQNIQI